MFFMLYSQKEEDLSALIFINDTKITVMYVMGSDSLPELQ